MRIATPRRKPKTVKLRKNGKHAVKGATMNAPVALQRIIRPQARFNWLMPNVASVTPQFIEMILNGALAGNHVQQYSLFDLMLRTWPELSECCQELVYGVQRKKLIFEPYHEEDEQPTPSATERMKVCSVALRQMQPGIGEDGETLEGTIKNILDAWFRGTSVSEIVWENLDDPQVGQVIAPRCTFWVDPVAYAFGPDNSLGLLPQKQNQGAGFYPFPTTAIGNINSPSQFLTPFPDNKFLVAIHKAKTGSPLGGALLTPLAWWWCAANFSADWLMNLAQVFGLPFRWANYDPNAPQATVDAICNMLQNMGSNAWAAFPSGTTLELIQPGQNSSDHSPQGELIDRADRYARSLILGQTMTGNHGTTGKGGGQAFGRVEQDVKDDRIDAAGKFAAAVINHQLIKAILMLNYGEDSESPRIKFLEDEVADFTEAQRDKMLVDAGLPIGVDYMRKKYDIPEPAEGEETLSKPQPQGFGGFGSQFDQQPNDQQDNSPATARYYICERCHDTGIIGKQDGEFVDAVACPICSAGDKPGHEFRGNQYTGNRKWDFKGEKEIGKVTHFTPSFWKKTPGDFTAASQAAAHYAKKQGIPMQIVSGNSYGHKIFTINPIHEDALGKSLYMGDEHAVAIAYPDGTITQATATKRAIHSGDKPGHAFHGNQHVKLGDYVQTPHGRGMVVGNDYNSAFVSVNGRIMQYKHSELTKIPYDHSNFPSLLQSEENKRRAALNTKLEKLNAIQDDAVFAAELKQLAEEIHAS